MRTSLGKHRVSGCMKAQAFFVGQEGPVKICTSGGSGAFETPEKWDRRVMF